MEQNTNFLDPSAESQHVQNRFPYRKGFYRHDEESPVHYKPGGFHPVRVGDLYEDYKVIRKLGAGAYSTVWLAEDRRSNPLRIANFIGMGGLLHSKSMPTTLVTENLKY